MTVTIHRRLDSDTIHLPELAALIGKNVKIIVMEEPQDQASRKLAALDAIAGKIDLDFDAIDELRRRSIL